MPLSGSDRIHPEMHLGFDDVRIEPAMSYLTPEQISLHTMFSSNIALHLPFVLSGATVDSAIAAAQLGGIGILPNDVSISKQSDFVRQVKRYQSRIVKNVMTVTPETSIIEALEVRARYGIGMMPVVETGTNVFAGLLVFDDATEYDGEKTVADYLAAEPALTVSKEMDTHEVYELMQEHQVTCAVVIDAQQRCVGLITQEDKEKTEKFSSATLDANGALQVAAMVGTDEKDYDRVNALIDAGADAIVVQAVHGHSKAALEMVTYIRRQRSGPVDVVVGNICTAQAALALIDAGANGLLVGDCGDYGAAGIGVPLFSAVLNVCDAAAMHHVPVSFNGLGGTDQRVKALAAGASALMLNDFAEQDAIAKQLRLALSHTGSANIKDFGSQTRFVRVKE